MIQIHGAKDRGAAHVTSLVASTAQQRGHRIVAFTEDPATTIFRDAGIEYVTSDLKLRALEGILARNSPDYIITGMSIPRSPIEEYLRYFANIHQIPLVLIEDVPGASGRTRARADFIFTTDEIGLERCRVNHPRARCFVAGNIGVKHVSPSREVTAIVRALREAYGTVYMFTESTRPDHGSIDEQIELFKECTRRTSGSFCVIIRLHPKWREIKKGGVPLHDLWMEKLQRGIPNIILMQQGSAEELAMLVDGVISVFSTLLTTAADHGKVAISLRTPLSVEFMREATGFDTAHIVELGCATEVVAPCDLRTIRPAQPKDREKLRPFSAAVVCDELERALGR